MKEYKALKTKFIIRIFLKKLKIIIDKIKKSVIIIVVMFDNKVWKTLVLITQVGLSILVPIFFLVWIGVIIKNKFSIDLILFLLILGVLVSIRNAYKLIKPFIE